MCIRDSRPAVFHHRRHGALDGIPGAIVEDDEEDGQVMAAPDKTLICCVGDGAYIFGSPTAAHWVSRAHDLPVLFVIFNNRAWNAVKRSVTSMVKDGWAARTRNMVLSELDPAPEYQMVCE